MIRNCRIALLAIFLATTPAQGWNDTGHRLVALIAWDLLPEASRDRLDRILRSHPRLAEDIPLPVAVAAKGEATQKRWRFAHAAVWPDTVKLFEGELRETWNRSSWHYINQPIYLTDGDRNDLEPSLRTNLELAWNPDVHDVRRLNLVQSITRSRHILKQESTSPSERALVISWLLHTVGDAHQPLHASALFSGRRFRRGDAGGNGIMVEGAEDLHAIWDNHLLLDVATFSEHDAILERYKEDERVLREAVSGARTTDVLDWLDESYDLAYEFVYSDIILDTVAANEAVYDPTKSYRDQPYLPEVKLSDRYLSKARRITMRRHVIAGHRLAAVLREVGF